jgi:NodT family efflux transporter outer membrane factor (OMF) lipoprotein
VIKSVYFFILLLYLLFAGCTRVSDKDLAARLETPSLILTEKEALHRAYFQTGEWPDEQWWKLFDDPQLSGLIERALDSNFTLKEARAHVAYTYQLAKGVRSKLLPDLSGNYVEQWQYLSKYGFDRDFFPVPPPGNKNMIPHTLNLIDLTLNFSYEFDFWGKNRSLFQAALGTARAAIAEERQTQLITALTVAKTYFAWQTKCTQRDILLEKRQERKDLFHLTDRRAIIGVDNDIPVYAAEKRIHQIQKLIVFLEEGIELDKHMLKYLVGAGPDEMLLESAPQAHFDRPFPLPDNISSDLLARRPDLMARIWRVEAAAQEIGVAKADFYPNVSLGAFGGLESLAFGNLFRDSKMGGVTPAIHLPIYTGGRLEAQLRSKVAGFNEAVNAYNDLVLSAAKEVADQIVTVTALLDGYAQQEGSFNATANQYNLLFARYEIGIDDFLSVLRMQDDVLQQRFILVGLYHDHLQSVLKLIQSLGGGYHATKIPAGKP